MNDKFEALILPLPHGGILVIRKDMVKTVRADNQGSRNIRCHVNGIDTDAGLDFVVKQLNWELTDEHGNKVQI